MWRMAGREGEWNIYNLEEISAGKKAICSSDIWELADYTTVINGTQNILRG